MKSMKEEMKICRGAEYYYIAALSILAKSGTTFSSFLRFAFTKKSIKREGQLKLEILFFSTTKNIILPFYPG
jgi:Na+/H+ antiporter NhaA